MELFSTILYIHVTATLGLVAAISVEGLGLRQLRRASARLDAIPWFGPVLASGRIGSICLLILFLSGGYLADRAFLWKMAWPKIAVIVIVAFGALAGVSSRRIKRVRDEYLGTERSGADVARKLPVGFLNASLSIRIGLILAAVLLMTSKPNFLNSVSIVVGFSIVSWVLAALRRAPQASGIATTEFERPVR